MDKNKAIFSIQRVFTESILIIVGVSIALWFENHLETMKEIEIEQDYIQSFHEDWISDIK